MTMPSAPKGRDHASLNWLAMIVGVAVSLFMGVSVQADPVIHIEEFPLWGEDLPAFSKPGPMNERIEACYGADCAYDVVNPTLTLFTPEGGGNGRAVLIAPGGNYDVVAIFHEGRDVAMALAEAGVTAAVLKYRIPRPATSEQPHRVPLSDFHQAMKRLRTWHGNGRIHASQVGAMGFSAGGHLVTYAAVHPHNNERLNPDFTVSVYGVSRLTDDNHQWLENHLYHRALTPEEIRRETLLDHVSSATPPAFLVHALDDTVCWPEETTRYAEALRTAGVGVEVHLFPTGGHGFGIGRAEDGTDQWPELAIRWLNRLPAVDSSPPVMMGASSGE